ncbi:hypothetical protein EWM64_g9172 [Hericium alpestre]|uniref:Uncharacterized protein n=1 Tax=Hericium alpestre TaxID=135208 RepID=A0A4Y9ZKU6_9AGAM|nr:hypothetical protein EWM64_g9172 [Hericium alpestre]
MQIFLPKLRSLKVEQVSFSASVEGDKFGFTFVKWWGWRGQKFEELPTLFMKDCELDAGTEEVFLINDIKYIDLSDICGSGDEEDVNDER